MPEGWLLLRPLSLAGRCPLLFLLRPPAAFPLQEHTPSVSSSSYKDRSPIGLGPHYPYYLSSLNYLFNWLFPNTFTMWIRLQPMNFGGDTIWSDCGLRFSCVCNALCSHWNSGCRILRRLCSGTNTMRDNKLT